MAETLSSGGKVVDYDKSEAEFARAMAAPPADAPEFPAPPALADPEAPFGRTLDGRPKKAPGGRPPKPRTTDQKPVEAPKGGTQLPVKADYSAGLSEAVDGAWAMCAMVPAETLNAQATLLKANKDNLVAGLNVAAQHNSYAEWAVKKIATGGVTWVIVALTALAPPFVQSMTMWQGDEALAELGMPTRKELAEVSRADFQTMITDMQDDMMAAGRDAGKAEVAA
jgi:hypothetical protein